MATSAFVRPVYLLSCIDIRASTCLFLNAPLKLSWQDIRNSLNMQWASQSRGCSIAYRPLLPLLTRSTDWSPFPITKDWILGRRAPPPPAWCQKRHWKIFLCQKAALILGTYHHVTGDWSKKIFFNATKVDGFSKLCTVERYCEVWLKWWYVTSAC